jgi:hypothetical protein
VLTPAMLPATIVVNKVKNMVGVTPITATDATSGVTFHWTYSSPVTVSAANALNAKTDGGPYSISLTVSDGAGHTVNAGTTSLTRDTWLNRPSWDYVTYGLPYVLWSEAAPPTLTWHWKTGGGGETPAQFEWKGDLVSHGTGSAVSAPSSGSYKPDDTYILDVSESDNALNSADTEMPLTPVSGPVAPPNGVKNVLVPIEYVPSTTAKIFQWRTVAGASSYLVTIDCKGAAAGRWTVAQPGSGDPFLSKPLDPEAEYGWFVMPLDSKGAAMEKYRLPPTGWNYFATIPFKG